MMRVGWLCSFLAEEPIGGTDPKGHGRSERTGLIVVVVVATIGRTVSALLQGDVVVPLPGIFDQISYDTLARRVLAGDGFSFPTLWWPVTQAGEPTAHWSFLYTLYLAAVYALFGPHPLAARLIQAVVVGVLHPWLSYRLGRRLFGVRVGLVAGGITAVYPYFVYYSGALMTESFYIVAILWSMDLAIGITSSRENRATAPWSGFRSMAGAAKPWVLLGLALGTAVTLRQLILLFVPFLFVWILWTINSRWGAGDGRVDVKRIRSGVAGLLVTTAVLFALIVPWTVRNYLAFDRFVLLNTNAGYAFFWANHPIYGTDFVPILPGATYQRLIPQELRDMDEAALDQALLREGVGFVLEDPVRYVRLSLSRIGYYFEFWPSPESSLPSNLARVLSFGVALPMMIYGLFLSGARRRRCVLPGQMSAVALLGLFITVYSSIHILSWTLIRYRLPVDAVLILFAGLAVRELVARFAPGSLQRLPLGLPLVSEGPSEQSGRYDRHSLRTRAPSSEWGRDVGEGERQWN